MRYYAKCKNIKGNLVDLVTKGKDEEEATENLIKSYKGVVKVVSISTTKPKTDFGTMGFLSESKADTYQKNRSRQGAYSN